MVGARPRPRCTRLLAALVALLALTGAAAHRTPDALEGETAAQAQGPIAATPQMQAAAPSVAPPPAAAAAQGPHAVAAAFLLVLAAGCCAPLGACVVAFLNPKQHRNLLPASLALAAGVMIYVSLYELLHESQAHFAAQLESQALVQLCTLGAFFAGVPITSILDIIADRALSRILHPKGAAAAGDESADLEIAIDGDDSRGSDGSDSSGSSGAPRAAIVTAGGGDACSCKRRGGSLELDVGEHAGGGGQRLAAGGGGRAAAAAGGRDEHLLRTSILVTLALAIHNMPEGLATFVGYMSAPSTGVLVAIAIALHNIPEGICIGIPVYFATGSKWKGVGWAAASGLTEPLGALIGLALQQTGHMDDITMGVILAMVAGIMVSVTMSELLPRALAYDRTGGRWTYAGIMGGIGLMAASLVLLALLEQ